MMKSNNIVKILRTGLLPLPNTQRGRMTASLFVLDYIRNSTYPAIFDCLERKGAAICGILFYYF